MEVRHGSKGPVFEAVGEGSPYDAQGPLANPRRFRLPPGPEIQDGERDRLAHRARGNGPRLGAGKGTARMGGDTGASNDEGGPGDLRPPSPGAARTISSHRVVSMGEAGAVHVRRPVRDE